MGERIDARIGGDRNDRRGDSVVGSDAVCRNDVGLRRLHGVCLWNVYLFDAIASGASEPTVNSLAILGPSGHLHDDFRNLHPVDLPIRR